MTSAELLNQMSWSDRRRADQQWFVAQKQASTEQLAAERTAPVDTPPDAPPAPIPSFQQGVRNIARVLTEAGIEHSVPSNGRIIHREVDR